MNTMLKLLLFLITMYWGVPIAGADPAKRADPHAGSATPASGHHTRPSVPYTPAPLLQHAPSANVPRFTPPSKTPVARVRMKPVSGNLLDGSLIEWVPVSSQGNLVIRGSLGMNCPSHQHLTYLAYQINTSGQPHTRILYQEDQPRQAGLNGKTTVIEFQPFGTEELVDACKQLLGQRPPDSWHAPASKPLKTTLRTMGRCSGGSHPHHVPGRLVQRDYPILLTLQCIPVLKSY